MAELPGWDRGRLAMASASDLEAARLIVYARAWGPMVREDIAGRIESLEAEVRAAEVSKLDGDSHRIAARLELDRGIARLREAITELRGAKDHQALVRAQLELDVVDEPEGDR